MKQETLLTTSQQPINLLTHLSIWLSRIKRGAFTYLKAVVGSEHCQARSAPRASAQGPVRVAIPPKRGEVRSLSKRQRGRKMRRMEEEEEEGEVEE